MLNSEKLIVLGLNEISFDFVKHYISSGELPNLAKLIRENGVRETQSEADYHLLEPWIQWVTIQTGLSYGAHGVFRLGDITERPDLKQVFETVEERGYSVGAVSPFNADNRTKSSDFFVPDPWTTTRVSGDKMVKALSKTVSTAVNSNAEGKLRMTDAKVLLNAIAKYPSLSIYSEYASILSKATKPGMKAIMLDKLLGDLFVNLHEKHSPDLAWLFLNSGAHIQHHYLYNSDAYQGKLENPSWYCSPKHDPLIKVLKSYDKLIGRIVKLGTKIMILTGLHQVPHDDTTFYWRLKDHNRFLQDIGLTTFKEIIPRMSRDFLVKFESENDAKEAQALLESYEIESNHQFSRAFQIDNRSDSLFVELVYPFDLSDKAVAHSIVGPDVWDFKSYVSFVAIKNGAHNGTGYMVTNYDHSTPQELPLQDVHDLILSNFPQIA